MTRRVLLRQSLPWCREAPDQPRRRKSLHASVVASQCYLTVSVVRDLMGESKDAAGYKRTERLLRQAGVLLKRGRRNMVARDSLGSAFPEVALRLAQCEVLDDMCD